MALLESPIFGVRNLIDRAATVITSAHDDPDLPAENLAEPEMDEPMRTANATGTKVVTIDFGSVQTWQALALAWCNFDAATRMDVESGDSGGIYTPVVSNHFVSPPPNGWPAALGVRYPMFYVHPTPLSGRYARFSLHSATTLSYYEAKRAFCGPVVQPLVAMAYGYRISYAHATQTSKTPRGVPHRSRGDIARVLKITTDWMTEQEALNQIVPDLELEVGRWGDVLVIPRHTQTATLWHDALWGYLTESEGAEHPNFNRWRYIFTFEERI
jgi:hypothetical protein